MKPSEEPNPPPEVWRRGALEIWLATYASPKSIEEAWKFEGVACQCPSVMSQMLFFCMSGGKEIPVWVKNDIQYTFQPDSAIKTPPTQESIDRVVARPFQKYDEFPAGTSIGISIKANDEWLPWIRVKKVNGSFRAFSSRAFKEDEVVTVSGGRCAWRSDAPYVECALGRELFPKPETSPIVYSRARDGMLQALDPSDSHLLLGAPFCRSAKAASTPNLKLNEAGEYISTQIINIDDELVVHAN